MKSSTGVEWTHLLAVLHSSCHRKPAGVGRFDLWIPGVYSPKSSGFYCSRQLSHIAKKPHISQTAPDLREEPPASFQILDCTYPQSFHLCTAAGDATDQEAAQNQSQLLSRTRWGECLTRPCPNRFPLKILMRFLQFLVEMTFDLKNIMNHSERPHFTIIWYYICECCGSLWRTPDFQILKALNWQAKW